MPARPGSARGNGRPSQQRGLTEDLERGLDAVVDAARDAGHAASSFLASDRGRELRRKVATAVIVSAPVIVQTPLMRRTALARLIRSAAVAGLLVRGAEWLRDWQPGEARPR